MAESYSGPGQNFLQGNNGILNSDGNKIKHSNKSKSPNRTNYLNKSPKANTKTPSKSPKTNQVNSRKYRFHLPDLISVFLSQKTRA